MKTKGRIHPNDSSKAANSQAETSSPKTRKPVRYYQDAVTLILQEKSGEEIGRETIPGEEYVLIDIESRAQQMNSAEFIANRASFAVIAPGSPRVFSHDSPQPGPKFDPAEHHPSCLCIFDRDAKQPVEKIPLSESEFVALCKRSIAAPVGMAEFVAEAIREKLAKTAGAAESQTSSACIHKEDLELVGSRLDEFSGLINQMHFLHMAIADEHQSWILAHPTEEEMDRWVCGYIPTGTDLEHKAERIEQDLRHFVGLVDRSLNPDHAPIAPVVPPARPVTN